MLSEDVGGSGYVNTILNSPPLRICAPQCRVQLSYYADDLFSSLLVGHMQDSSNRTIFSQAYWQMVKNNKTWNTLTVPVGQRPDGKMYSYQIKRFIYKCGLTIDHTK